MPWQQKATRKYPVWFDKELILNLKKKEYFRCLYKRSASAVDLELFRNLRTATKEQMKRAFKSYIVVTENNMINNPKHFWQYINLKKKTRRLPAKMRGNNNIELNNTIDIVNSFANCFEAAFIRNNLDVNESVLVCNNVRFDIQEIMEHEILTAIESMKESNSAGYDFIPGFIVKDLARILVKPLFFIYNASVTSATFPTAWKTAKITPVHKSGDRADIHNYRPVSVLSIFSKIFEKILYNKLYNHVNKNISQNQHGFMVGRSTVSNLILKTQFIADCFERGRQVDVVYTDISKAFDSVNHVLIIKKLSKHDVSIGFLRLMKSYLSNRQQFVNYLGERSRSYKACSGVPQGSILGPLLFILFMNDISIDIDARHLLYADDLKIYAEINTHYDAMSLQLELDKLLAWCIKNGLNLNINKCKTMTYALKKNVLMYNYRIGDTTIDRVSSIKDLGVLFDAKLSFKMHIHNITSSAYRSLGLIIRQGKDFRNILALRALYYAYVRSRLEYASQVWNPCYGCLCLEINKIERKFLKYLYFKTEGHYPERGINNNILLNIADMKDISKRRAERDLSYLEAILDNRVDVPDLKEYLIQKEPREGARNNAAFYIKPLKRNVVINAPMNRMCRAFNERTLNGN